MNSRRRDRIRRRARHIARPVGRIRYVIPTSTRFPNRNWLVLVTKQEFVVLRLGWWFMRPKAVACRAPRTLLEPRRTISGKRVVLINRQEHFVPLHHLHEVDAQNDDLRVQPPPSGD